MSYNKDNLTVVFANFFPIKAKDANKKIKFMIHEIQKAQYRQSKR